MAADKSGSISALNANLATGVPTANSTVLMSLSNLDPSTAAIQVTGVFTATLVVQASLDGVNWVTLGGTPLVNINTAAYAANITAAGIWQADPAGFAYIRVTCSAYTSGTAVVTLIQTAGVGLVALDAPLPTGANVIGTVNATTTPLAATAFSLNSAATTNATSVKATAGSLYTLNITNFSAAAKFVKLYNKATAPTVGTDVPLQTIEVAANASRQIEYGALGVRFTTGIGYAITGLQPDADATAVAAGDVKVHGSYV